IGYVYALALTKLQPGPPLFGPSLPSGERGRRGAPGPSFSGGVSSRSGGIVLASGSALVGQFPASLAGPTPAPQGSGRIGTIQREALMWSSRRASAIVAVLALMGLLTSLQTAVAQKEKALVGFKRPPRGDRPYTSPTVATGDPSDLGGLTLTPDDK